MADDWREVISGRRLRGGAVQARTRLESAWFQNFKTNEEKIAFNLNPCFLSLRHYNVAVFGNGDVSTAQQRRSYECSVIVRINGMESITVRAEVRLTTSG